MYNLKQSVTWKKLEQLANSSAKDKIADAFVENPNRFDEMSLRLGGLFLDYSKNLVSQEIFDSLIQLAEHSALRQRRAQIVRHVGDQFTAQPIGFLQA